MVGAFNDRSTGDPLARFLAPHFTVITYDRAGLGKSDVVPGAWKVQSAVSDLKAGLKQLGITKDVTLVAHSQAGEIASAMAAF